MQGKVLLFFFFKDSQLIKLGCHLLLEGRMQMN